MKSKNRILTSNIYFYKDIDLAAEIEDKIFELFDTEGEYSTTSKHNRKGNIFVGNKALEQGKQKFLSFVKKELSKHLISLKKGTLITWNNEYQEYRTKHYYVPDFVEKYSKEV